MRILPFQAQCALLNDDMLGYGKTFGRGLGRELAQLRKINVMSDWRQTTNEAMDGRRHGQGALRFSATAQDQRDGAAPAPPPLAPARTNDAGAI